MPGARKRVMMVSSEVSPWARTGGLADVLGALPQALALQGYDVGLTVPRYMNAANAPAQRVMDRMTFWLGPHELQMSVWAMAERHGEGSVTTYFLENAGLYGRPELYGDSQGDYPDNHIRFGALSRAAVEISRQLFYADLFHCHDWQASLVPVYLHESSDPAKTLLTIHNLGYQGLFDPSVLWDLGLGQHLFNPGQLEFWGRVNFLKAGIVFSAAINTVSRKYAEEVQTEEYGFGLDGLLRERREVLSGILNGVDYARWNPSTDGFIASHFSPEDLSGKRRCKAALLAEMELPEWMIDRPLLGIVSRFATQKGFDLIGEIAERIFEQEVGLVALGNGEARYEDMFRALRNRFPDRVALKLGFNDGLAHRIEAGADIFLMPSHYEPCGLNQIYSLKYGTLPVVRATGGLDDTIDESTGFKFADYNGSALLDAIRTACGAWYDRERWAERMVRGMHKDFSWAPSARAYAALYERL